MYEFDCPQPVTVAVRLGGGGVDVLAEERHTAQVEVAPVENTGPATEAAANTVVELRGDTLIVQAPNSTGGWLFRRTPRLRVTIRVPLDSALALKVASADVRCRGRYSGGKVSSASGDVHVDEVTGDVEANTASGNANVDRAGGQVKIDTASGDVRVGYARGDVVMHSASGNLELGQADASVRATTASGDIRVAAASHGTVRTNSASGDVSIGVTAGTGVWLDLSTVSGTTRSDLTMSDTPSDTGANLTLQVRTVSGDIEVHRVSLPAAA